MAARKKKRNRKPFESSVDRTSSKAGNRGSQTLHADDPGSGLFGFFRDFGVRETIESIIVAIILAMMFRGFEAEAFIIPTGSMAPSLQGQHMELECEHCRHRYRAGASQDEVVSTYCPICQYRTNLRPSAVADHRVNSGDRILVNKFVYDSQDPERYDVIVFKNPTNGKQNYIKRLVGMPGDNLLIENGDIYTMDPVEGRAGKWTKTITRKPPEKLLAVLQVVDDTDYIGPQLQEAGWPIRWSTWDDAVSVAPQMTQGKPAFHIDAGEKSKLIRYRHYVPRKSDWSFIESKRLPPRMAGPELPKGRLIGDYYSYNDRTFRGRGGDVFSPGLHWVGDVGLEASVNVESSSGTLVLDVVEGGAHFRCEVDVSSGEASLSCDDPDVQFVDSAGQPVSQPAVQTSLKGNGSYEIRFVNADDRLNLWVDGELAAFGSATYLRDEVPIPQWSETDAGDAEPLGIGFRNGEMTVSRLKVLRDVYYSSVEGAAVGSMLSNETSTNPAIIRAYHESPERWSEPDVKAFFRMKKEHEQPMFKLQDFDDPARDQFLPCGDNSPSSSDGRVWNGPKHLDRDMLIGRAIFIYWPHTKNRPTPYFPNFESMKFIR